MTQTEEQTLAEQEALLAECKLYKGEKEPDTKDAPVESDEAEVVTGLPVTGPATTIIGAPVHRTPWSTGIFACFGNGDEHFSSDLEVCECPPSSYFILFYFISFNMYAINFSPTLTKSRSTPHQGT